jgi:hypothetical protein
MQAAAVQLRQQNNLINIAKHEKELALRQYKSAEKALEEAKEALPPLKMSK